MVTEQETLIISYAMCESSTLATALSLVKSSSPCKALSY